MSPLSPTHPDRAQRILVDGALASTAPELESPLEIPEEVAAPYCPVVRSTIGPDAWKRRVPAEVVAALLDSGPTLIVGDAPGDPDCFCSAVALARGRAALHLPADAHVDAPPPSQLSGLGIQDDLVSSQTVSQRSYDTVVFVDNDGTRVGPAAEAAMRAAKRVVVIDHHEVDPTHVSLGLDADKTELIVFKEIEADAAALLVLATLTRMIESSPASLMQQGWGSVLEPLVTAIYSDTRGFDSAHTRPTTLGLLRGLLDTQAVDLSRILSGFGGGIPREVTGAWAERIEERTEKVGAMDVAFFTVPSHGLLDAWSEAREQTPELTWSDVLFSALDHVEARVRELDPEVALIAVGARDELARSTLTDERLEQLPPSSLKFSVRTKDGDLAPLLASALGGGGKPHQGGGVSEERAVKLADRARRYLAERQALARFASARNLGGL
ncbi:MAG: DHH family phosphoesterase [Deltaproteobacteria bacterium]